MFYHQRSNKYEMEWIIKLNYNYKNKTIISKSTRVYLNLIIQASALYNIK